MQGIRSLIWPINLWALPIHAIPDQARRDVERVAFVRPPTIYAHGEIFAMRIPIATRLSLVVTRKFAVVVNGSTKFVGQDYDMHNGAEIIFVKFIEHFFG